MAEPNKVYDDQNKPLSARERADSKWGMNGGKEAEQEATDERSGLNKAREKWGEADVVDGEGSKPGKKKSEDSENKPEAKSEDSGYFKPDKDSKLGIRARIKGASKTKKWAIGAGAGLMVTIVGGLIAIISFLMPFKVGILINQIENRVGQVPEYAVEQRLEYYMNRYLILRTLATEFSDSAVEREFVYIDDGVFGTLYTNWKGAKLEKKLNAQGWKIEPRSGQTGDLLRNRSVRPSSYDLVNLNVGENSNLRRQSLNSKEARAFVKEFSKSETKSSQIFKRWRMRKMLGKYYGIRKWAIFENKRESARKTYLEKKLATKITLVEQTIGRVSSRYGLYLTCILNGGSACKDDLAKGADTGRERTNGVDENGNEIANGPGDAEIDSNRSANSKPLDGVTGETSQLIGSAPDGDSNAASKRISAQIRKLGMKKILTSFAAGIGIIDTVAQIYNSLESGALSIVINDKLSQQYAGYTSTVLSMSDQVQAGEAHIDDVRILNEIFDNYQKSPVYQTEFGTSSGTVSALTVSGDQIARDCNGDDSDGEETILEPGETVCPNKKLVQDKTSFTNTPIWESLKPIVEGYNTTFGSLLGKVTGFVGAISEGLGLDRLISGVMDALGLSDALASAFESLLHRVIGFEITGTEVEEDAYDNVYAGMSVNYASAGGGVGTDRTETIGGAYLSDEQVFAIQNEQFEQRQFAKSQQSFTERYLSLENSDSLAASMLLNTPSSVEDMASSISSIPSSIFGNLANIFSLSAGAEVPAGTGNPFDALYHGYPTNHEVFTANGGEGMSYGEIDAKYACDESTGTSGLVFELSEPGDFGIPFGVHTEADPCLLEQTVEAVGSKFFDGTYDEGLGSESTVPGTAYNVAGEDIEGQNTVNIPCPTSPTVTDAGTSDGWLGGEEYKIRLCRVHGVTVNSIIAQQIDDMFTAMKAAGYSMAGSGSYRSYASQVAGYDGGAGSGTFAKPGYSRHNFGTAVDITCSNSDGTQKYVQGSGRGREEFSQYLSDYPCLNWVHENSQEYGVLLQCDGQSSSGGEIRANSGGCEVWHLSPTGG